VVLSHEGVTMGGDPRLTFEQGKVVVSGLRQPRSRVRAREGWWCLAVLSISRSSDRGGGH
jgi:hypothetical protein